VRNGFVVRALGEGTDAAGAIGFNAREKAENPPVLVIHFADPDTDDPPEPPAPPEPAAVSCGQVLTKSTLVTNDLAECLGDGLVIGAPRIVVDLGGHTIDGVGLGTGIANDGHADVTVRNGTVQQFDTGLLLLAETRGNLVENVTFQLNELAGIELFTAGSAAEGNEIRGNTVTGNGGGIVVGSGTVGTLVADNGLTGNGGGALVVRDSNGNRLERNLVTGGGDLGVEIERASGNVLLDNTVSGTSDGGIEVMAGSHDNLVQGNAVDASGDMGILVSESSRNRLIGNVTHGMSDSGISLSAANDGVVLDNDLRFNPGGLQVDGSSRNLISGNEASETTGYGIELGGDSFDNDVVENRAVANAAAGIYVSDEALAEPGNRVARNTANGNGGDGILLAKGGHVVTANVTRDNVGWGISAAPGSIDGGGNVASGNGASGGQCSGVACTDGSVPPPPDTSPPETRIDTGPASPTIDTAASFTFSASEAGASFDCSLDGAAFAPCTSPLSLAGLGAGEHELRVRATDAAGNADATPAAHPWTILPQSTCTPATFVVGAAADSWILQSSSTSNYGDDSVMKVDSKSGANARVLVRFSLPALEPGCRVVAAQLRLNASSAKEGRSLQAVRAATAWSEGGVTWANQPAAAGPAATARSAEGYVEWAVAPQVAAMYSEGNHGFLVLDAAENGEGIEQGFHSREKGEDEPPQLILTVG
jgi:parallel beta-helix repeat protein